MKKFILIFAILAATAIKAQEFPDVQSIAFEGASFGNSRTDFLYQLKFHLGWQVLQSLDAGDILDGKYCDCDCLVAVEYTKERKFPVSLYISIMCDDSIKNSVFSAAIIRLSKWFGDPVSVENRNDVKVWQPKYSGYEMLNIYSSIVILEKEDKGITIKIMDMINKMILDSEKQKP